MQIVAEKKTPMRQRRARGLFQVLPVVARNLEGNIIILDLLLWNVIDTACFRCSLFSQEYIVPLLYLWIDLLSALSFSSLNMKLIHHVIFFAAKAESIGGAEQGGVLRDDQHASGGPKQPPVKRDDKHGHRSDDVTVVGHVAQVVKDAVKKTKSVDRKQEAVDQRNTPQ